MVNKTKIIIIGGFLGAGKTTSILSIAQSLLARGNKVGVVTNDQGSRLVDTAYLKSHGLEVLDVTGGCFCCNFDKFVNRLRELSAKEEYDYILAEPVGSCTDLVSTMLKPMKDGKAGHYQIMPLSIVVDPVRLLRLSADSGKEMPDEVKYLLLKQLEEADIIAVNKLDLLNEDETHEILNYLTEKYPKKKLILVSAKENVGIDNWIKAIQNQTLSFAKHSLDIEYDLYAKAEADLGWLNTSCKFETVRNCSGNDLILDLAERLKEGLLSTNNEIAHLKLYLQSGENDCKLSCTSIHDDIVFDKKMNVLIHQGSLLINIRANIGPKELKNLSETALKEVIKQYNGTLQNVQTECFAPSYPNPFYRYLN